MSRTIVFVGHGTRLKQGIDEWLGFVRGVVRAADLRPHQSRYAFIELESPSVEEVLIELGKTRHHDVILVPTLLFSAGHMKWDLPQAVERAMRRTKPLCVNILQPFGTEASFLDVGVDRAYEAVCGWRGGESTGVVFVARGNQDVEAQCSFQDVVMCIARALSHRVDNVLVEAAYLAGSGRSLEAAMESLARQGVRRIAVIPYLWFSGMLTYTLPKRVERWRQTVATVEVKLGRHLGCDSRLITTVAERVRNVLGIT
ncbi:sirohydrochlorin chelatase [Alicyclobacillus mali (ex Roth et al. 2021)]|uniref:sirohydrochlorin chelatase n=1 Tax=Alicyclobacillus mali (ex Roth et al. 2021) TaxID=1123961 RepID=UPI001A8F1B99